MACKKCDAKCCKYFALQIDAPRSRDDFENLRWYITHKNTAIFYEKGKWFLEIKNECKYLTSDYKCSIYERRPKICREHGTDICEIHGEAEHDLYFKSLGSLDNYIKRRFSRKKNV